MTGMNRDDLDFLAQIIALETAPLVKRIEALEEKINWVTETDWAAIGRQQRAPEVTSQHSQGEAAE